MEYYLRVEGVNLGNFVYDTSDLATIRGGSLLLLDAVDLVEEEIQKQLKKELSAAELGKIDTEIIKLTQELNRIKHDNNLSKKEKKQNKIKIRDKKKLIQNFGKSDESSLIPITKGASWGLFKFDTDSATADKLTNEVKKRFSNSKKYKHATFVVNLYLPAKDEEYKLSRSKAQALNRFQQLAQPSFAIPEKRKGICSYDKIRPADTKYSMPGDEPDDYLSESVEMRRRHGRSVKNSPKFFYQKRTLNTEFPDLKLTRDFEQLSECRPNLPYSHLGGKIAFIYIDGNEFGKKQQKCKQVKEQSAFDQQTRKGREEVLKELLLKIIANPKDEKWFNNGELRLETLLWGGDEIIWVVPAWQGWWMMKNFYELADRYICLKNNNAQETGKLYHGASIVFCKHKAPIQTINSLAKNLADGFAKISGFKQSNMFAYQVLESFDHVGSDLYGHRKMLINSLSNNISDLLINADDMQEIENCICQLKKAEFPRRKLYQIIHNYRKKNNSKAEKFSQKLITENAWDTFEKKVQKGIITKQLDNLKKTFFNDSNIYWLHLMELWDYVGTMKQF